MQRHPGEDRSDAEHADRHCSRGSSNPGRDLGFEDENEAAVLGEICRGHGPNRSTEGSVSWGDLDREEADPRAGTAGFGLRLLSAIVVRIR